MSSILRWGRALVRVGLAGTLAFGLSAGPAVAQTATTTFQVTATVQATCLIAATDLAFGAYTGVQADATSTITITCTNTTTWNIGLNAGTAPGATVTTRRMLNGAAQLAYALFRDPARTLNWGTTIGTDTLSGTGTGIATPLTVYGRVTAAQFPAPGGYVDTITATITF